MKQIGIIGAGTWGTALAVMSARAGHQVSLWSRTQLIVESIERNRFNPTYLKETRVPDAVTATTDLRSALSGADLVILAAPSHALRELLKQATPFFDPNSIIVSAAKGIEIESGKRISQILDDVAERDYSDRFVCLSGPSFAKEVVLGHPTAVVASSLNQGSARTVQTVLSYDNLRIYTNNDLVGTELGGSVKNVMAIAAGMTSGLGFGANSLAALITRGLAELTRLALREGGRLETLMGLAGLGDLVLTCTGHLSRNRFVGEQLGQGKALESIVAGMDQIAEGIKTTMAIKRLTDRIQLEMPITNEVYAVLYEAKSPRDAVGHLMRRPLRDEIG